MLAFGQLGPNPTKPKFHGKYFKQKVSGLQKLLVFFHKIVATKNQFWTEPNSSLRLALQSFLLSYSQLCHHCYFWQSLFNELLQWLFRLNHLASKKQVSLGISLVFQIW